MGKTHMGRRHNSTQQSSSHLFRNRHGQWLHLHGRDWWLRFIPKRIFLHGQSADGEEQPVHLHRDKGVSNPRIQRNISMIAKEFRQYSQHYSWSSSSSSPQSWSTPGQQDYSAHY